MPRRNNRNKNIPINKPQQMPQRTWDEIVEDGGYLQEVSRIVQSQREWRDATLLAESRINPLRYAINRTYKEVTTTDAHLMAIIENRQNRMKQLEYDIIDISGNIDEEIKKAKFERSWFNVVIDEFINHLFFGHSLLQILSITDYNIDAVELVEREFVSPERGLILNTPYILDGHDYRKQNQNNDFFIEIGRDNDLGLLLALSNLAIWKKNDLNFWATFVEMFGIPYRVGRVPSDNPSDRNRMAKHLMKMGSSGFAILRNTNEAIEILENNSSSDSDTFQELAKFCNGEMTKLVLGAAGIIDGLQSGTQSQSNVHQQQLNVITKADVKNFEYFCKEVLFPKLVRFGVIPEGHTIKFKSLERTQQQNELADLLIKVAEIIASGVFDIEYIVDKFDIVPDEEVIKKIKDMVGKPIEKPESNDFDENKDDDK